jgi:hypothetical protein
MAVRLEIGWRPDLTDADGEGVRRQAREYFGLDLTGVRVLRVLMLDVDLPPATLEAIRTDIFTHPTTQVSSFQPLAKDFHWAIWVRLQARGAGHHDRSPGGGGGLSGPAVAGRTAVYTSDSTSFPAAASPRPR